MSQQGLTRQQQRILDFMVKYRAENGVSPTLNEIAEEMGLSRTSIFGHIGELVRKKYVQRLSKKKASRNWEPVAEQVVEVSAAVEVVDATFKGKGPQDLIGDAPERLRTRLQELPAQFRVGRKA